MLDKLTVDDFKGRIGETFRATPKDGGEPFELELRRADPSGHGDEGRAPEAKDGPQREGGSAACHPPPPPRATATRAATRRPRTALSARGSRSSSTPACRTTPRSRRSTCA